MSKVNEILNLLRDQEWTCTSEMAALYTVDARRRLCDLKDKGYILEGIKCTKHDYHRGRTKMWRLVESPQKQNLPPTSPVTPKASPIQPLFIYNGMSEI